MGWYLYCIGPRGLRLPGTPGLDDAPLRLLPAGSVAACVSARQERPAPTVARVRRHHEVIRVATTAEITPLPVRFGQWFRFATTLREMLREGQDALERSLSEVRNAVEFTVRAWEAATGSAQPVAVAEGAATGERGTGTAFMRSLARLYGDERATRERGLQTAHELRQALLPLIRAERVEESERLPSASLARADRPLVCVTHLVAAEHARRYLDGVRRHGVARPALRLDVHGPYPPYSFVG